VSCRLQKKSESFHLGDLTRVSVDEESFRGRQLGKHGLRKKVEDDELVKKVMMRGKKGKSE
jgi:hypothetical protein